MYLNRCFVLTKFKPATVLYYKCLTEGKFKKFLWLTYFGTFVYLLSHQKLDEKKKSGLSEYRGSSVTCLSQLCLTLDAVRNQCIRESAGFGQSYEVVSL